MKTLFICRHNLGRSQIACALYNYLTDSHDADSAGTATGAYPEKTLGQFKEITNSVKAMRELGLDLSHAPRRQITPALVRRYDQIVSFLPLAKLPEWLQKWLSDNPRVRLQIWDDLENYPTDGKLEMVRRQRDELQQKVRRLVRQNSRQDV